MAKAGRKSTYDPKYCQMMIDFMGIKTIERWSKEHEDFAEAWQIAHSKRSLFYEKIGIAGIQGKLEYFNQTAWIFCMKQLGWRDTIEHTGANGGPIKTESKVLNVIGVSALSKGNGQVIEGDIERVRLPETPRKFN